MKLYRAVILLMFLYGVRSSSGDEAAMDDIVKAGNGKGFDQVDMRLTAKQRAIFHSAFNNNVRSKRSIFDIIYDAQWPDGIVAVTISDTFAPEDRQAIINAMGVIERKSCIRFDIYSGQSTPTDHVAIFEGSGCWSYIGKLGGMQQLSLGARCLFQHTIIHELLHVLGFFHEQSRPDRDQYITIYRDNIQKDFETNFDISKFSHKDGFGVPYDPQSVMHYGKYTFTKNRKSPTMVWKANPDLPLGGKKLSPSDIKQLNIYYKCNVGTLENLRKLVTTTKTTRPTTTTTTTKPTTTSTTTKPTTTTTTTRPITTTTTTRPTTTTTTTRPTTTTTTTRPTTTTTTTRPTTTTTTTRPTTTTTATRPTTTSTTTKPTTTTTMTKPTTTTTTTRPTTTTTTTKPTTTTTTTRPTTTTTTTRPTTTTTTTRPTTTTTTTRLTTTTTTTRPTTTITTTKPTTTTTTTTTTRTTTKQTTTEKTKKPTTLATKTKKLTKAPTVTLPKRTTKETLSEKKTTTATVSVTKKLSEIITPTEKTTGIEGSVEISECAIKRDNAPICGLVANRFYEDFYCHRKNFQNCHQSCCTWRKRNGKIKQNEITTTTNPTTTKTTTTKPTKTTTTTKPTTTKPTKPTTIKPTTKKATKQTTTKQTTKPTTTKPTTTELIKHTTTKQTKPTTTKQTKSTTTKPTKSTTTKQATTKKQENPITTRKAIKEKEVKTTSSKNKFISTTVSKTKKVSKVSVCADEISFCAKAYVQKNICGFRLFCRRSCGLCTGPIEDTCKLFSDAINVGCRSTRRRKDCVSRNTKIRNKMKQECPKICCNRGEFYE